MMPEFDVLIVPIEKMNDPNVRPKSVQIKASNMREAVNLALKFNPGCAAHPSNVMKNRNA